MDEFHFWQEYPPHDMIDVVRGLLKEQWLKHGGRLNSLGHPYWTFDYKHEFDLSTIEGNIRQALDGMNWHFVTISNSVLEHEGRKWKWFGARPIVLQSVDTAYHATRLCTIPRILNEGLLPSNKERSNSQYPDTEGVIHICTTLRGDKESAEKWMGLLSEKSGLQASDYGVLQVNMQGLVARVYQDMHSTSGLIVDRVERIPPERIEQVQL